MKVLCETFSLFSPFWFFLKAFQFSRLIFPQLYLATGHPHWRHSLNGLKIHRKNEKIPTRQLLVACYKPVLHNVQILLEQKMDILHTVIKMQINSNAQTNTQQVQHTKLGGGRGGVFKKLCFYPSAGKCYTLGAYIFM